jgi:hypothetical protein
MSLPANAADNLPLQAWPAPRPQFEQWSVMLNHPTRRLAVWLRGTLLATAAGARECRTWAVWADADQPDATVVVTQRLSQDAFRVDAGMGVLRFGEGFQLWTNQVTGAVADREHKVSFHLSFEPGNTTAHALEGFGAGRLSGGVQRCTPNSAVRMGGHVTLDGERVAFVDALGHQGHWAGTRMPDQWTWGKAGGFEQDAGGWMEALALPRGAGSAASMNVQVSGQRFALNRFPHLTGWWGRKTLSESALGTWKLEGAAEGRLLRVNVNAMGLQPVRVRELDPQGQPRFSCVFPWASCAVGITPSLDGATASSTYLSKGKATVLYAASEPLSGTAQDHLPRPE